jgi:hypothetical protein
MAEAALLIRLRRTIARTKDPIKKARLQKQLAILTKKTPVGKSKSGDPIPSYGKLRSAFKPDESTKSRNPLVKLGGNLSDYSYQKPDYTAISKEAFEDVDPSYWNFSDPFKGLKHGGRVKKTKKRKSRGVGVALRGYGKVMRRG